MARKWPIDKKCPRCEMYENKHSYMDAQEWGGGDYLLTCSDSSSCNFSMVSHVDWSIGSSGGQDTPKE